MKLRIAVMTTLILSSALAGASEGKGDNGRYEGIAASDNAVWVVDTRTGKVRKCTQDFADQQPVCSKMSN